MSIVIGQAKEALALSYLQKHGLKLIAQNFRLRCGELDLIMQAEQTLVFVEVRYRKCSSFGGGLDSVGFAKQAKLRRAAQSYLQRYYKRDVPACRFDVVAIDGGNRIEWIQDAF